eukprot:125420-Pyramimonas_sp.AAC.1
MGPRSAVLGGEDAHGHRHWDLRWSSWGPRSAVLGWGNACGHRRCDLRWGPLCGHETPCWVGEAHAGTATVALSGAPDGATKR